MRILYPAQVPSSLPAFEFGKSFRYYFKPSMANSFYQINHVQLTLVRVDTNKNQLPEDTYPLGVMFIRKTQIGLDTSTGYYYFDVPGNLIKEEDLLYKIQIRLGEDDISSMTAIELKNWFRASSTLEKLSEWSIPTIVVGIVAPDFGIQGLDDNEVESNSYLFVGYYTPKNPYETLTSYKFILYDANMKELATSGERFTGQYEKDYLQYSFKYEMEVNQQYIVMLKIKTKNLYTGTKVYNFTVKEEELFEVFSTVDIKQDTELAQTSLSIESRQLLFKPTPGSVVSFVEYDGGGNSHAYIDGTLVLSKPILYQTTNGKCLLQAKGRPRYIYDTLLDAIENPIIKVEKVLDGSSSFNSVVKIGLYRYNTAYPTSTNLDPTPVYEYRFILRKEIRDTQGNIYLSQTYYSKHTNYYFDSDYYFWMQEDGGVVKFSATKI